MIRVLTALENVFTRYVPWHSEQEMRDALQAITDLKNEIQGTNSAPENMTPEPVTQVMPLEPVQTNVPAENATPAVESVSVTTENPSVPDAVTVEPVHIPEPEAVPFPGSYTPPPAA